MNTDNELKKKIDSKTKPPGSLGTLEHMALQAGMIQQTLTPALRMPTIIVFAGDHGIAEEKVSAYPKEVTRQMVLNFLHGGAAINVFCRQHGIRLKVVDAGVDADFEEHEHLIHAKIRKGTSNIMTSPAMSEDECRDALKKGGEIVFSEYQKGCNIIGFGEMGIGNTSSASLLMSRFCGIPVEKCVGRGTGHDDEGLKKKTAILEKAFSRHKIGDNTVAILAAFGGFEIAMMTGAMMKAAELGMIILVDGFIATAALLAAHHTDKTIVRNCIFSHQSGEAGHALMLQYLGVTPVLDLGLRLGEGTGAALVFPVVQSAVNFLNEMASFESARVTNKV